MKLRIRKLWRGTLEEGHIYDVQILKTRECSQRGFAYLNYNVLQVCTGLYSSYSKTYNVQLQAMLEGIIDAGS